MNILEQMNRENTALQSALEGFTAVRYGETALDNLVKIIDTAAKLKDLAEREMDLLATDMQLDGFILSDYLNANK
jgi:hypothetical protein